MTMEHSRSLVVCSMPSRDKIMTVTESLAPHLPYLRRYARALTGSQSSGDAYVRAALTALLAGKTDLSSHLPPPGALYPLFHLILGRTPTPLDPHPSVGVEKITPQESF